MLGFTTLIAVVDVVLVTAIATLGAFLYNLSASLLGGLEVTPPKTTDRFGSPSYAEVTCTGAVGRGAFGPIAH